MAASLAERFTDKVLPEPMSGCWLWDGATIPQGYGAMTNAGRRELAHRVSFELHCAPIPAGQSVLHRCDVRACVNPDHLFLGTHRENMADMVGKGRQSGGARRPLAKLAPEQIPEIRRRIAAGESYRLIGRDHGVDHATIRAIDTGRAWRQAEG